MLKSSLRFKLLIIFISIIIVFSIIVYFTAMNQMRNLANNDIVSKMEAVAKLGYKYIDLKYPGSWRIDNGKLYKGNVLINNNFEVVDEIREQTGALVTIFQYDTRVSTNVKKADGSRAVGTKVAPYVAETVLKNGKVYTGEADVVGKKCQTTYIPIKDQKGDIIGIWFAGLEKEYITAHLAKFSYSIIGIILICVILAVFTLGILIHKMIFNIEILAGTMKKVENENDLTVVTKVKSHDELEQLSTVFNNMISKMKELITEVKSASANLLSFSKKLSETTEESGKSMEEISSAISNIAVGMSDNVKYIQDITENVNEVTKGIEMIAQTSQLVTRESEKVKSDAFKGGNSVKEVLNAVSDINDSAREVLLVMNELGKLSQQIGSIIEIITGISTQTNLLSLNAAIEAARAGDVGKGFAVVAEEIRKLALESSNAAKSITDLIVEVQSKIKTANEKMFENSVKANEGFKKASDTSEYIQQIISSINNMIQQIYEISNAVVQQSEVLKQINSAMNNINSITETTATNAEEISASIQQQTSALQQLGYTAIELTQMVQKLDNMVNQFKV